jgi:hypothetical protein
MEDPSEFGAQPHELPSYLEKMPSQLPALHLLVQLGHIRSHCRFTFKGTTHP